MIEIVAIIGSLAWFGAAIVTGIPKGLVPSEVSFTLTIPAIIGALIALANWTADPFDPVLLSLAGLLYVFAPVVLSVWILTHESVEELEEPRTIS